MNTVDVQAVLLAMAEMPWSRYEVFASFDIEVIAFHFEAFYFDGITSGWIYVKQGSQANTFRVYRVGGNRLIDLEGTDVRAMVHRLLSRFEGTNSWG